MIDPRSTGSTNLDARATVDCAASAKAKSGTSMNTEKAAKTAKTACK
jgi:hypothetical protein